MERFDIRDFLTENKLTETSKRLDEQDNIAYIGFYDSRDIDQFKEMLDEVPQYGDVQILDKKRKVDGSGNSWWDVKVDISSLDNRDYRTFVNDIESEWNAFFD